MSGVEFLFDTNVVVGHLKGRGDARELIAQSGAVPATTAVSQITRMELLGFPGITQVEERLIADFLASTTVLSLDDKVEAAIIAIRRATKLKLPDAIIVATARVHSLRLLTFDSALSNVISAVLS